MNYIYIAAFTANMICFIAATSLTWTSPILSKLTSEIDTPFSSPLSDDETSWISALLPLGALFGSSVYGLLADWIGRKPTLLICGVPSLLSYLALAFGNVPWVYYVARFLSGSSVGGIFTVIPMYLGEIAENSNRGALGSSINCFFAMGGLLSYSVGPYTSILVFNLVLAIFPAIFLVLFFLFAPESPHYYAMKQKDAEARSALYKIRSGEDKLIEEELNEIHAKIKEDGHGNFFDIFRSKGLTKAFAISVGLVTFQQFSGINAVLFFAQTIFQQFSTTLDPQVCSIIIGGTQFLASFVTPLFVDRFGRKILLLISAIGMIISEIPLGFYNYLKDDGKDVSSISFLPILCLIAYIIAYNIAFASLPLTIMGELFPANVKSIASTATISICCFLSFLITKYFQSISDSIGIGSSFWIFGSCCVLSVPFCLFYVIETKGKSLHEIQNILSR